MKTVSLAVFGLLLASQARADFEVDKVYVCDFAANQVLQVDPDSGAHQVVLDATDGLSGPSAIQIGPDGRLLVANFHTSQVLAFDSAFVGQVVLDAADGIDGPGGGSGLCLDREGHLYVANRSAEQILRFDADFGGGTVFADDADGIASPEGLCFDANGRMIAGSVQCSGLLTQFDSAGTPSLFDVLFLEDPQSIAVRSNGDVYVLTLSGQLYRYEGGAPANRSLLGVYGVGPSLASIQFRADSSALFHVNAGDGALRRIDPDSGAETLLASAGWDAVAMAVVGSEQPHGGSTPYGRGTPGKSGVVPRLRAAAPALINGTLVLEVRDFVGKARSFLLSGDTRSQKPLFGGELYVDLSGRIIITPVPLPGVDGLPGTGDIDLSLQIPFVPSLLGLRWHFQHFALDPAAVDGISMSNGLSIYIGR